MIRPKRPFDVLIIEDEALLAMDVEDMVEASGHHVVGEAASMAELADIADGIDPDLALVDVQLARGDSGLDACAFIRERWPAAFVVFVTANPLRLPSDFCGAHGVIPKPFSRNGLMSAMRYIEEGMSDPPPEGSEPASFTGSPAFVASWA